MHETYMRRCLELAQRGAGMVAPNPLVGAVLVYRDRIIGEGWHRKYGEAHAEVNCFDSVSEEDRPLIPLSTLYVSLEPCDHFGKTPPCTDLVLRQQVKDVVIGSQDPFEEVNGKGIRRLREAGVTVQVGVLESECREVNKRFFTFHTRHRPYTILKWAQTADGLIAGNGKERLLISNERSNKLVHRWRSEEAAILVGTNTALYDNPYLTTRHWPGRSPERLVLDWDLRLPAHLHLFDKTVPTIVFNAHRHTIDDFENSRFTNLSYYRISRDAGLVPQVQEALYRLDLQSLIVEGGTMLLQAFIDSGRWDEARVITNISLRPGEGRPAPVLQYEEQWMEECLDEDMIRYFRNTKTNL